jgi:acyl-CoA thioesterase FadM
MVRPPPQPTVLRCVSRRNTAAPFDRPSHMPQSLTVWPPASFFAAGDTVDGSGEASHPNVLDMFERCRSAGLGGAVVLKQRSEEANNAFVVGRIDRAQYVTADPAVFGDRLEVRSVVELKFRKAGIIFHQSLWRAGGAKPLVDCVVSVYSIDKATKKPCPVPSDVEASLTPFLISPPQ